MAQLARNIVKKRLSANIKGASAPIIHEGLGKPEELAFESGFDNDMFSVGEDLIDTFESAFNTPIWGFPEGVDSESKRKTSPFSAEFQEQTDDLLHSDTLATPSSRFTSFGPQPPSEIKVPIKPLQQRLLSKEHFQRIIQGKFNIIEKHEQKNPKTPNQIFNTLNKPSKVQVHFHGRLTTAPISVESDESEISISNPSIRHWISPSVQRSMLRGRPRKYGEPMPEIREQNQIRGIPRVLAFVGRPPTRNAFLGKYFKCEFYPPDHIRAYYRKSRAAVMVIYGEGFPSNDPDIKINKKDFPQSPVPQDYGFFRAKWRKMVRQKFLEAYKAMGGIDGLFHFRVNLYPSTPEAMERFDSDMLKCLELFASRDYRMSVKEVNSKFRWGQFKDKLKEAQLKTNYVPPYIRIPHNQGNWIQTSETLTEEETDF